MYGMPDVLYYLDLPWIKDVKTFSIKPADRFLLIIQYNYTELEKVRLLYKEKPFTNKKISYIPLVMLFLFLLLSGATLIGNCFDNWVLQGQCSGFN